MKASNNKLMVNISQNLNEIELLRLEVAREKKARVKMKEILVSKVVELNEANHKLAGFNAQLENKIARNNREIAASELRYRTLVETAQDIIYNISYDGYFLYMNHVAKELFGHTEAEMLGRHFTEFIALDYKKKVFEYYENFLNSDLTKSYFEFPIITKDGTQKWVGQNVQRVENNAQFYFSAYARDITDRVTHAKEISTMKDVLAKSETKYRSMIENMDLGILEVDVHGKVINVYEKFCRMTGYTKDELLGQDAMNLLVVPEFRAKMVEEDEKRKIGASGNYEIQLRHKDGSDIWVIISGAPFHDESGNIIGSAGIHYDITDRKKLEGALRSARLKAEEAQASEKLFLANMSHEIRTPLNAIIGMTHMLSESKLTTDQEDLVQIILHSSNLLHSLINDILDVSKIEAGSLMVRTEDFDLVEMLHKIKHTFAVKAREKDVDIKLNIKGALTHLVHADPLILNQVLMNLVGNAEKFTDQGEVCINVLIGQTAGDYIPVRFEVNDTGIGINPNQLKTIFDKFKQVAMDSTKRFGGTGLGLNITKKLLEMMDSEIHVKSMLGKGSSFTFELQLMKSGNAITSPANISSEQSAPEGFNQKAILIAEDNKINQKYLSMLLKKAHISYHLAIDGVQAVDMAQAKKYDMILMDIQMPNLDGFNATRQIRANSKNMHVPIVGLTAMTLNNDHYLTDDSGLDDYLAKPYTPVDLYAMLRYYLKPDATTPITTKQEEPAFDFSEELDAPFLKESYGNDVAYALDIFSTFLTTTREELALIALHVEDDNWLDARKVIHRIQPTFRMVGLPTCSIQCAHLETMAAEDWRGFKANFISLMQQYPERKKGVEREMKRMQDFLSKS